MSTIYVKNKTKKELTKIMKELQSKMGKKLDIDETIMYLISIYRSEQKRMKFFKLFREPIRGVTFEEAYDELMEERGKKDDPV